jgi:hypothetical protein
MWLQKMALFADSIGFGEPPRDFVVDLVDALETKGVEMIPRRESFDPAETRILQAPGQNNVAVDPVSPDHESSETHPDLERDPGFLRQDSDGSVLLRQGQEPIEDGARRLRFALEMRS